MAGRRGEASLEKIEPAERTELTEHQHAEALRPGVELLGQAAADRSVAQNLVLRDVPIMLDIGEIAMALTTTNRSKSD